MLCDFVFDLRHLFLSFPLQFWLALVNLSYPHASLLVRQVFARHVEICGLAVVEVFSGDALLARWLALHLKSVKLPLDVAAADHVHTRSVLPGRQGDELLWAALIWTLTLEFIDSHHSFIRLLTVQKLTDSNIVLILLQMLVIPNAQLWRFTTSIDVRQFNIATVAASILRIISVLSSDVARLHRFPLLFQRNYLLLIVVNVDQSFVLLLICLALVLGNPGLLLLLWVWAVILKALLLLKHACNRGGHR